MIAKLTCYNPVLFWALCELWASSYGLKTAPKSLCILMRTLLVGLSRNNCVGVARILTPHLGYWTHVVQAVWSVRRSLFIVFFINLVNLKAENAIAYITIRCSVLAVEYESMATVCLQRWVPLSSNFEISFVWKLLVATCVAVWGGSLNAHFQRVCLQH